MKSVMTTSVACVAALIACVLIWYTLTMKPPVAPAPLKAAPQTLVDVERSGVRPQAVVGLPSRKGKPATLAHQQTARLPRRIASELGDLGQLGSPRRVAKLMKNQGLRAQQPKSFQPRTTNSRHRLGYSPNLLWEAPLPTRLD